MTRIGEAVELRRAGITAPVLARLHDTTRLTTTRAHDIDVGVCSAADLVAVSRSTGPVPARVHLKLDTGLHRSGCPGEEWTRLVHAAAELQRTRAIPGEPFFTEAARYASDATRFTIPAPLPDATSAALETLALTAFRTLGCRGLARVDFFVTPDGPVLNEVNTFPGFTAQPRRGRRLVRT